MSKISTAKKHDLSCGFANVWGGGLNRYELFIIGKMDLNGYKIIT